MELPNGVSVQLRAWIDAVARAHREAGGRDAVFPTPSPEIQFELLQTGLRDTTAPLLASELAIAYFGGTFRGLFALFTITQGEYLAWARSQPLEAFVGTTPDSRDGHYLVREGGAWHFHYQERAIRFWGQRYASEAEARESVYRRCSPHAVFTHLRDA